MKNAKIGNLQFDGPSLPLNHPIRLNARPKGRRIIYFSFDIVLIGPLNNFRRHFVSKMALYFCWTKKFAKYRKAASRPQKSSSPISKSHIPLVANARN